MSRDDTSVHGTGGDGVRPTRRVLVGGLIFLLGLIGLAGYKSYRDLDAVRARHAELEHELERTDEEITTLETRIERLKNDPLTLERLAREQLQMVHPGDVVIVLPEESPSAGPEPPIPTPTGG